MKLSRIEPFVNSVSTDSELERVQAELDQKSTEVSAVAEDPEALRADIDRQRDPKEGVLRLCDFLKKQAQKRNTAQEALRSKALKLYKTQQNIEHKSETFDETSASVDLTFKKIA